MESNANLDHVTSLETLAAGAPGAAAAWYWFSYVYASPAKLVEEEVHRR